MRPTQQDLLLPEHHRHVQRLLKSLAIQVREDDPRDLCAYWTTFERELNDHIAAEEEFLLPAFARAFPHDAATVYREHERIRELLDDLGLQIDLHCVRAEVVDQLIQRLAEHADREDALLYPWAAANLPTYDRALPDIRARTAGIPADLKQLLDEGRLQLHLAGMDAALQFEAIRREVDALGRKATALPRLSAEAFVARLRRLVQSIGAHTSHAEPR
jgi:hemerythrin-like domain-containing protein